MAFAGAGRGGFGVSELVHILGLAVGGPTGEQRESRDRSGSSVLRQTCRSTGAVLQLELIILAMNIFYLLFLYFKISSTNMHRFHSELS